MSDGGTTTQTMRAQIELRERILGGDFRPGARLMEVSLADALGISRTPVREAMARLAEEGLLERNRSGGFRVRSFSLEDVIDAIELRGVLEGTAARLAAERGIEAQMKARLDHILDRLDGCLGDDFDFEGYSAANADFHETLWGLSGSEMVRREVARVAALPFASPSAFMPDKTDIAAFRRSLLTAQEQHRWMVEAIVAREGSRAEALAREHARTARRNLAYLTGDGARSPRMPMLSLVTDDTGVKRRTGTAP